MYNNASSNQLVAVIMQEGKPLDCYSRKLNPTQTRHNSGETRTIKYKRDT
jgi:hypothetical protein